MPDDTKAKSSFVSGEYEALLDDLRQIFIHPSAEETVQETARAIMAARKQVRDFKWRSREGDEGGD